MRKFIFKLLAIFSFSFAISCAHAEMSSELSEEMEKTWRQCNQDTYKGRELILQQVRLPTQLKTLEMMAFPDSEIFTFTYRLPNVEELFCQKKYKLVLINLFGKIKIRQDLKLNDKGEFQGRNGEYALFSLYDVFEAEPFCILILDENNNVFAAKEFIPKPIQMITPSKAAIRAKMIFIGTLDYIVKGSGFLPNEKLKIIHQSSYEYLETAFRSEKDGTVMIHVKPQVIGQREGKASITIIRNMKPMKEEKLYIEYNWINP